MSSDYFKQISPEYLELKHQIHFFYGLKEVGVRSTREAEKAGYMLISPAGGAGGRRGIYIPREELPLLEALIEEIAARRDATRKTRAQKKVSKAAQRDDRRALLRKELEEKAALTAQEWRWFEEISSQSDFSTLTSAQSLEELKNHRESQALLANAKSDRIVLPCECSVCKKMREGLKEIRRSALLEVRGQLAKTLDFLQIAESYMGKCYVVAKEKVLEEHYMSSVREVSAMVIDGHLEGDERERVARLLLHYEKKLKRYKVKCEAKIEQGRVQNELNAYFHDEFWPWWEEERDSLLKTLEELGQDDGGLLKFYEQQMLDVLSSSSKDGKRGRERLRNILGDARSAIIQRVQRSQQREVLQELYETRSDFAQYFPKARALKREIWFYCGPTNSGKTYSALNDLAAGSSGLYLAPLRLLALEGQEELSGRGVSASYVTGEERDLVEGATFVSSTIEMLDYDQEVDVAVIDEIQMIEEPQRGWAWTSALVGVPAKKVILTGSANALPVIQEIVDSLNEPLQVRSFTRFNELRTEHVPATLEKLQAGTAIICFSRRDVLGLKQEIERNSTFGVSVIYGGLSPEVRREEARRFRERETEILVATDAISMGLNLPIRTVLFWRTEKRFANRSHPLRDTEIKQIAGRAGRYGLEDCGYVGAFSHKDLRRISEAMDASLPDVSGPCVVRPLLFHIEMISKVLDTHELKAILRYFQREIWFSRELFVPTVTDEMIDLSEMLRKPLWYSSLKEKYAFICAPVDLKANSVIDALLSFAKQYASGVEVRLPEFLIRGMMKDSAQSPNELRTAEDYIKIVTLYRWLSYRFPESFLQVDKAQAYKEILNDYISRSLSKGGLLRRCKQCDVALPMDVSYGICDDCYYGGGRSW